MFKLSAILLAAVVIVGGALAHEGATGIIAERMTAMKNMGRELKALEDILARNAAPLDISSIVQHAEALHENCHRTIGLFPPGSVDHHSKALPAIWEKPEAFNEQMHRLHSATEALVGITALGDEAALAASVKQIKEICGGCHETFRKLEN